MTDKPMTLDERANAAYCAWCEVAKPRGFDVAHLDAWRRVVESCDATRAGAPVDRASLAIALNKTYIRAGTDLWNAVANEAIRQLGPRAPSDTAELAKLRVELECDVCSLTAQVDELETKLAASLRRLEENGANAATMHEHIGSLLSQRDELTADLREAEANELRFRRRCEELERELQEVREG